MALFSKLFGGGGKAAVEPVEHAGFRIFAQPVKEAGGFRVAARIEKEIGGEVKVHMLIRADVCAGIEEATTLSLAKARQVVDEQGEAIFG